MSEKHIWVQGVVQGGEEWALCFAAAVDAVVASSLPAVRLAGVHLMRTRSEWLS